MFSLSLEERRVSGARNFREILERDLAKGIGGSVKG